MKFCHLGDEKDRPKIDWMSANVYARRQVQRGGVHAVHLHPRILSSKIQYAQQFLVLFLKITVRPNSMKFVFLHARVQYYSSVVS